MRNAGNEKRRIRQKFEAAQNVREGRCDIEAGGTDG